MVNPFLIMQSDLSPAIERYIARQLIKDLQAKLCDNSQQLSLAQLHSKFEDLCLYTVSLDLITHRDLFHTDSKFSEHYQMRKLVCGEAETQVSVAQAKLELANEQRVFWQNQLYWALLI